eukprot:CAMPEP_0118827918 /NCGR_PEP_ID=MMETSP1162-20130426/15748_1 /TAXON_ID=33656 /ORGANISM="Phaeocystis Sp, Strain CCMP2710" /LENGTH=42 /DNA_ID= /DNA_START= /DNA_END= /DNA_ORIENTATION=
MSSPAALAARCTLLQGRARARATWLGLGRDEQPGCVGSAVHL